MAFSQKCILGKLILLLGCAHWVWPNKNHISVLEADGCSVHFGREAVYRTYHNLCDIVHYDDDWLGVMVVPLDVHFNSRVYSTSRGLYIHCWLVCRTDQSGCLVIILQSCHKSHIPSWVQVRWEKVTTFMCIVQPEPHKSLLRIDDMPRTQALITTIRVLDLREEASSRRSSTRIVVMRAWVRGYIDDMPWSTHRSTSIHNHRIPWVPQNWLCTCWQCCQLKVQFGLVNLEWRCIQVHVYVNTHWLVSVTSYYNSRHQLTQEFGKKRVFAAQIAPPAATITTASCIHLVHLCSFTIMQPVAFQTGDQTNNRLFSEILVRVLWNKDVETQWSVNAPKKKKSWKMDVKKYSTTKMCWVKTIRQGTIESKMMSWIKALYHGERKIVREREGSFFMRYLQDWQSHDQQHDIIWPTLIIKDKTTTITDKCSRGWTQSKPYENNQLFELLHCFTGESEEFQCLFLCLLSFQVLLSCFLEFLVCL